MKMDKSGSYDIQKIEKYIQGLETLQRLTEIAAFEDADANEHYEYHIDYLHSTYADKTVNMEEFVNYCDDPKKWYAMDAYRKAEKRYEILCGFDKIVVFLKGEGLRSFDHYAKEGYDSAYDKLESKFIN